MLNSYLKILTQLFIALLSLLVISCQPVPEDASTMEGGVSQVDNKVLTPEEVMVDLKANGCEPNYEVDLSKDIKCSGNLTLTNKQEVEEYLNFLINAEQPPSSSSKGKGKSKAKVFQKYSNLIIDGSISLDSLTLLSPCNIRVRKESSITTAGNLCLGSFKNLSFDKEGSFSAGGSLSLVSYEKALDFKKESLLSSSSIYAYSSHSLVFHKDSSVASISFDANSPKCSGLDDLGLSEAAQKGSCYGKTNAPPIALISCQQSDLSVTCSSAGSSDDKAIVSYSYLFSDGSTLTNTDGLDVTHSFLTAGNHSVTLTTSDAEGLSSSASSNFLLNTNPVASFSCTSTNPHILNCTSTSSDVDGSIASYSWTLEGGVTYTGASFTHQFTSGGDYNVTLAVTDDLGGTGSSSQSVSVLSNQAPIASFNCSSSFLKVSCDASASSDADGSIVSYSWSVDGQNFSGSSLSYTYLSEGAKTVSMTVTDNLGAITSLSKDLTLVANKPPVISFTCNSSSPRSLSCDASASTDSDGIIISYVWSLSDGSTQTGSSFLTNLASGGSYEVTVVATDDQGASSALTKSVVVLSNQAPVAVFDCTVNGLSLACDGNASTDPEGGSLSYVWEIQAPDGSEIISTQSSFSIVSEDTELTTLNVVLTVRDAFGAENSLSKPFTLIPNEVPIADFSCTTDRPWFVKCDASLSVDPDGFFLSYEWTLSDGSSFTGKTFSQSITSGESVEVSLKVIDIFNGEDSILKIIPITQNSLPTAVINCFESSLEISCDSSLSFDEDGSIVSYNWVLSDGSSYQGESFSHLFSEFGEKIIALEITDELGGVTSKEITLLIEPNIAPSVSFSCQSARPLSLKCRGVNSSDFDGFITSYSWNFGDDILKPGDVSEHVYLSAGNKVVTLEVQDNLGKKSKMSQTFEVFENIAPIASFNCSSNYLELNCNGSNSFDPESNNLTYLWEITDSNGMMTPFSTETISVNFQEEQNLSVKLTVFDTYGASSFLVKALTLTSPPVQIPPKAYFTYSIDTVANEVVLSYYGEKGNAEIISAEYEIVGDTEIFPIIDLYTASKKSISGVPEQPLEIKLTVVDSNGQSDSFTHLINPAESSVPYLKINLIQSAPLTAYLRALGSFDPLMEEGDLAIDWGDGSSETITNGFQTHLYAEAGIYNVTTSLSTERGVTSSVTSQVEVTNSDVELIAPTANFEIEIIDFAEHATFQVSYSGTPNGQILGFEWDFGDGTTGVGEEIVHIYDPGVYLVNLKITDSLGLTATQTQRVVIMGSGPELFVGGGCEVITDRLFDCFGGGADRLGQLSGFEVDWGDGSPITYIDPVTESWGFVESEHNYLFDGNYTVTYTANTSRGDSAQFQIPIVVGTGLGNQAPVAYAVCTSNVSTLSCNAYGSFDADGFISNYEWHLGDGTVLSGAILNFIDHEYLNDGQYAVILKVLDNLGAESSITQIITIDSTPLNMPPTPDISCSENGLIVVCNAIASKDPDGEILGFQWDFGDGTLGSGKIVSHTYTSGGSYDISFTATDDQSLGATTTKTVILNGPPTGEISCLTQGETGIFCQALNLQDDGTVISLKWNLNGEDSSSGAIATYLFSSYGTKEIILEITDDLGAVTTLSQSIVLVDPNILPLASFSFETDHDLRRVSLDGIGSTKDGRSVLSYKWDFGDGSTPEESSSPTTSHIYQNYGEFLIGLTVTDSKGQTNTSTKLVKVIEMPVPDPGELNNQTMAGIDSDGDGIRDDVQRMIASTGEAGDLQAAIASNWQQNLNLQDSDVAGSVALTHQRQKLIECLIDTTSLDRASELSADLKIALFNTKERLFKWADIMSNFAGQTVTLTEGDPCAQ